MLLGKPPITCRLVFCVSMPAIFLNFVYFLGMCNFSHSYLYSLPILSRILLLSQVVGEYLSCLILHGFPIAKSSQISVVRCYKYCVLLCNYTYIVENQSLQFFLFLKNYSRFHVPNPKFNYAHVFSLRSRKKYITFVRTKMLTVSSHPQRFGHSNARTTNSSQAHWSNECPRNNTRELQMVILVNICSVIEEVVGCLQIEAFFYLSKRAD